MMDVINTIAWIGANVLVAYISLAVVAFVVGYYVLFDPRATTAGKMIFRFMLSLVGVILLTFVGTFVDPSHNRSWFEYPDDVDIWRPIARIAIYGYVAYTITSLAVLLWIRKWKPHLVKKASDLNLVQPRHTGVIPIIHSDEKSDSSEDSGTTKQ